MKRRMLSLLLVIALAVGMLPVFAAAETAAPAQDDNGVYEISTPEELLWFAQQVNGGNNKIKGALTQDIDMSAVSNWPGIGLELTYKIDGAVTNSDKAFAGSFDGQNHTVTFNDSEWGLFGYVFGTSDAVATIQNVRIAGSVRRAAVAYEVGYAHFTKCINRATVTGSGDYAAGIVGKVNGRAPSGTLLTDVLITNCGNDASVSSTGNYVGGILGYSKANTRLDCCYNKGNIHGKDYVGGLAGYLQESTGTSYINHSYNTGAITGSEKVGGIIGSMQNGVEVKNCYNAGAADYAIAGSRLNHTAVVTNSHFMGVKSPKSSPDFNDTLKQGDTTKEIQTRATAQTAAYMAGAQFVQLLGASSFKQSCPTPVLAWETEAQHTGDVCSNCALGSNKKEVYDVSFQEYVGYTVSGEPTVTDGQSYTFRITIGEKYKKLKNFQVKANGNLLTAATDGSYTILKVSGPLSITVSGVQEKPDKYSIYLPGEGYGYRANGNDEVANEGTYTFTLKAHENFLIDDIKVVAREYLSQELIDQGYEPEEIPLLRVNDQQPYQYQITNVQSNYQILVSGVKARPYGSKVTVNLTISEGYNNFYARETGVTIDPIMDYQLEVPYFDLSLYGLERYYYNQYCYRAEDGTLQPEQKAGTPESAYGNITLMHAYIVATEIFQLKLSENKIGTGESYKSDPGRFSSENAKNLISWTQGPGSSFMDFWDHGTNMNYYQNYTYPLGVPGWGSTSDQILIENGDEITLHLITGTGSGSRFGVFTVNDADGQFQQSDPRDTIEVDQGEQVTLTLYWTNTTADYSTAFEKMPNKNVFWTTDDYKADVSKWYNTPFGVMPGAAVDESESTEEEEGAPIKTAMSTNAKGNITIKTAGVEPGTYYIGALGGFTEGGAVDQDGFVSKGAEAGPSFFKLVIKPYNGKLGDVTNDTKVNAADAAEILKFVAGQVGSINATVANVNGDSAVNAADAAEILKFVAGQITSFPAAT